MKYCENQTEVPEEFMCPLTLEIMLCPVVNRQGINYEKSAIISWLSQPNATCPLTRKPLALSDFIPNVRLQQKIHDWRQAQGEDLTETAASTEASDDDHLLYVRVPIGVTEALMAEHHAPTRQRRGLLKRLRWNRR